MYLNYERKIKSDNKKSTIKREDKNNFTTNILLKNNIKDTKNQNFNRTNSVKVDSNINFKDFFLKKYNNNKHMKYIDNSLIFEEQKTAKKNSFPYRYYLFPIITKCECTSSKPFSFTKKFILVYNYICQLVDISSYLIMQKEFELMKSNNYFDKCENNKDITENDNLFDFNKKLFEE